MSVFTIVDNNVQATIENYPELLSDLNNDIKQGAGFMLYALKTIFKNYDFDDIEKGIVDSSYRKEGHDYGIDAIYITANDTIINSVEEIDEYGEETKFSIHILQFKKGRGIEQSDLLKLKEGINQIFIQDNCDEKKNQYLFDLIQNLKEIRNSLYQNFSSEQIKIQLYIAFAGLKATVDNDDLLQTQIFEINRLLEDNAYLYVQTKIIDSQKLIDLSKQGDEITDVINYQKTFKYITQADQNKKLNGYICIINALEIAKLVEHWQSTIFEANIRDYYRRNPLNKKIIETSVSATEAKYFWSYNNGLTITCRKVEELPNDQYRLYGIQIVNGCQTSNALYIAYNNYLKKEILLDKQKTTELSDKEKKDLEIIGDNTLNNETTVLIKVIETNDNDLIYRITETTNSQTPIKSFSLKANENIQQHIEQFFIQYNIYYERRVNFYKNQGKKNIISIQKLFQVFTASILFKPSQVRTRPQKMLSEGYDEVFPATDSGVNYDYNLYLVPIQIDMKVGKIIRSALREKLISDQYLINLMAYGRLHLIPLILHSLIGPYSKTTIVKSLKLIEGALNDDQLFNSHFNNALENLKRITQGIYGTRKESVNAALKKTDLDERIVRFINAKK